MRLHNDRDMLGSAFSCVLNSCCLLLWRGKDLPAPSNAPSNASGTSGSDGTRTTRKEAPSGVAAAKAPAKPKASLVQLPA